MDILFMKAKQKQQKKKPKVSRKELAEMWFGQGCDPAYFQYLVVKCQTSPENIKLDPCFYTKDQLRSNKLGRLQEAYLEKKYKYYIDEIEMLYQIRDKWYTQNKGFLKIQDPQQYVMVWNNTVPLKWCYTAKDLKSLIGCEHLDENVGTIGIYLEGEAPIKQDETAVDPNKHKQQNLKKLTVAIKVQHQKEYPFYHEIECEINTTISTFKSTIDFWLNDSKTSLVLYSEQNDYSLYMDKSKLSPQCIRLLSELQADILEDYQKPQLFDIFAHPQFAQYTVGQLLIPGDILYLEFHYPEKAFFLYPKDKTPIQLPNPLIKVIYFQQQVPDSSTMPPFQFSFNYLTLMNVKVSTVLKEHNVKDSFFTSLYGENKFIRPFQKFQTLKQVVSGQDLKQITLYAVHENIYFYREINRYNQYENDIDKMENLWHDEVQQLKFLKSDLKVKLEKLSKIFEARKKKIEKQEMKSFCYPILLYSSPYVYQQFNRFFRNSSLAIFQKDKFKQNLQKYYPLARQLIKRLLLLPNYHGVTFRGTRNHGFNYKVDQVIEWNAFSSTSKDLKTARTFLKGQSNPYLFVIQCFTGKPICEYSFYEAEDQILILPYTRFKVKNIDSVYLYIQKEKRKQAFTIDKNQNFREKQQVEQARQVKVVRIKEIPVPKIFSGMLIIWIDPNIYENSKAFIDIIKRNDLTDIDLVQLESNQHFNDWLKQFSFIFQMPKLKVYFITNMSRPSEPNAGIQTLQIVRGLNSSFKVVFYVGSIQKTQKIFDQNQIKDPHIKLVQNIHKLEETILTFV